jgi:hypothetical protein
MNAEDLAKELPNVVALLTAFGDILPGRVDPAVVEYLDRASKPGVEVELLHSALALHTQAQAPPAGPRKLKFGT